MPAKNGWNNMATNFIYTDKTDKLRNNKDAENELNQKSLKDKVNRNLKNKNAESVRR